MNKEAFIAGFVKTADPLGFFGALGNTVSNGLSWPARWLAGYTADPVIPEVASNVPKVTMDQVKALPNYQPPIPGISTWWDNQSKLFPINSEGKKEWGGWGNAWNLAQRHPQIGPIIKSWQSLPSWAKWAIPLGGMAAMGGLFNGGGGSPNITVNVPPTGGGGIPQQAMFPTPNRTA